MHFEGKFIFICYGLEIKIHPLVEATLVIYNEIQHQCGKLWISISSTKCVVQKKNNLSSMYHSINIDDNSNFSEV